jgi:hypothetical protein
MEGSLVAYKVFTNGSVLQASEINDNLMNQSVMVFTNVAARTAALTSPVEGMLTWIENVNQYQFYNGTAWEPMQSGYVHLDTRTFSAVTSFSFPNGSFSSVFDAYKITFVHESGSAAQSMSMRLRASGVDASTTNYYNIELLGIPGSAFSTGTNANNVGMYPGSRNAGFSEINIINPFKSLRTFYQLNTGTVFNTGPTEANTVTTQGFFNLTTVFDSLSIIASTGNFTGYAQLYGLRK